MNNIQKLLLLIDNINFKLYFLFALDLTKLVAIKKFAIKV
jgi:hypothetical protein